MCGVNSAPCGACRCLRQRAARSCAVDLYPLLNGAYAELLRVPARIARVNLHRVPDGVAARGRGGDRAARLRRARRRRRGRAAPASASRSSAAARSGACSHSPARRAARPPSCSAAARATPRSYETVIEAAGTPEAWEQAIDLAAPGGTVVLFGGLPRETVVPRRQLPPALRGADPARLLPPPAARRARRARPARARGGVDRAHADARVRARRRRRAAAPRRRPRAPRRAAEGGDPPVRMFASQLRRLPVNDPARRAHRPRARHRRDDAPGRARRASRACSSRSVGKPIFVGAGSIELDHRGRASSSRARASTCAATSRSRASCACSASCSTARPSTARRTLAVRINDVAIAPSHAGWEVVSADVLQARRALGRGRTRELPWSRLTGHQRRRDRGEPRRAARERAPGRRRRGAARARAGRGRPAVRRARRRARGRRSPGDGGRGRRAPARDARQRARRRRSRRHGRRRRGRPARLAARRRGATSCSR